jgi:carboxypeptidase Taq
MRSDAAYRELIRLVREQRLLASCSELLGWDEEVCMPAGGVENRANQHAFLAGLLHERQSSPRLGDLLGELEGSSLLRDPSSAAAVNLRAIRRDYERATRLPRSLVEEEARVTSLAQHEWAAARRDARFSRFRRWLDRIVDLKRKEAAALGSDAVPYDALLEEYEPGVRSADLVRLFEELRPELVVLTGAIAGSGRVPDTTLLRRDYPVDRQRQFVELAASAVGFDFNCGRLDTATHPFFSSIGPGDCRLTTRFDPHDLAEGLFATLHETGHGLYEQGLDPEHQGTPLGEAPSLALHESQARLWENAVGRGRGFWRHFFPQARRLFPEALGDVELSGFLFAVNRVEPGPLRVPADEVTYNLHILVRFELEQALLQGDLKAADVPAAWNAAYRRYLGVEPSDDAEGCLQDGHWAAGQFAYFPTYTLGNVYAAQLYEAAERGLGGLEDDFARGDFSRLLGWLRDKVHREGGRYPAAELIERATGSPPTPRPLLRALRRHYGTLYGV